MKQPNFAAMSPVVAKAIEQMMAEQGDKFSLEKVNLAELKRRTGISRARLRRMKEHGFEDTEHAAKGRKASTTLLSGYTGILDGLLKNGVTNSAVCLSRLRANGYSNLVLVTTDVHRLLHATKPETIRAYMDMLKPDKKQMAKINRLRKMLDLPSI